MFNFQSVSLASVRFHCYEARRCGGPRGEAMFSPLDEDGDCFNADVTWRWFYQEFEEGIQHYVDVEYTVKWCISFFSMHKPPVFKWKETKTIFLAENSAKRPSTNGSEGRLDHRPGLEDDSNCAASEVKQLVVRTPATLSASVGDWLWKLRMADPRFRDSANLGELTNHDKSERWNASGCKSMIQIHRWWMV